MKKLIDISELPNFEVTCSNGNQYVLLPFEHLSDIPVIEDKQIVNEVLDALEKRIREAWGARNMFMPPREGYAWNDEFIDVKTVYKFIDELREKYNK